jgi:hypothetical protein
LGDNSRAFQSIFGFIDVPAAFDCAELKIEAMIQEDGSPVLASNSADTRFDGGCRRLSAPWTMPL